MPLRNPLGRIKDTALGTIKDPVGTAGRAVGQARGSVSTGRSIVGQVAGEVTSRLPRRGTRAGQAPEAPAEHPVPAEAPRKDQGDALADVHDRVHRPPKDRGTGVSATPADVADAVAKKAPAAKRKAAAKTTAEKKTAATTPGDKLPATRKAPAKKTSAKKSAAKRSAAKKSAAKTAPAKKATTKTAPAKKATAKKGPARKAAAGKATARKSSSAERPLSAAELAAGETPDVTTPVGTTGADVATNPDTTETDLQQPGTEPIVDPGTAKAVASEADTLRRAAQTDKG